MIKGLLNGAGDRTRLPRLRLVWCCRRVSRRQATVHRTVALRWVRVRSALRKGIPRWGIPFLGAGDRTRTGTPSLAADFESATSTISSHRQVCYYSVKVCAECASRVPVSGCGARNFLFAVRSRNFDRGPSLGSLLPPQAALTSLPRLSPVPPSLAADFESATSTFFSHRQVLN